MTNVSSQEFYSTISGWFSQYASHELELIETTEDENDEQRYTVVRTFSINPKSMDKLFIEVWLAKDSKIGVGIELNKRVYKRLGSNRQSPKRFVLGHEPDAIPLSDMLYFLTILVGNDSGIYFSKLGLKKSFLVLPYKLSEKLSGNYYSQLPWVRFSKNLDDKEWLQYKPWVDSD